MQTKIKYANKKKNNINWYKPEEEERNNFGNPGIEPKYSQRGETFWAEEWPLGWMLKL